MAPNPNPSRVTDAQWWLWEQLHALEPTSELGGIYTRKSGYHGTRLDNQTSWPDDYSIRDWTDLQGPNDKASAYDWTFPEAQIGDYSRIGKYTRRLIASAKDPNDPRLNGWREFYGNADGNDYVDGWDTRYGFSATSDNSHLWHIHASEAREFAEDMQNKRAFLSVVKGETVAQYNEGGTNVLDLGQTIPDTATSDNPDRNLGQIIADLWRGGHIGVWRIVELVTSINAKLDTILQSMGEVHLELTPDQLAELTQAVTAAVIEAPDNPLGTADEPAITRAVKAALTQGTGE